MSLDKTPHSPTGGKPHVAGRKAGSHLAASLKNVTVQRVGGPGQTWTNLTKDEVDQYQRSQPQKNKAEAGPSVMSRLAGLFKRKSGSGS